MGAKPKAGGGKKREPPDTKTEKSQSEQFIEAARELGVDETGQEFERLFEQVVRPVHRQKRE